ncbi:MAG: TIM barrel protein [Limisphaerales bacterium]
MNQNSSSLSRRGLLKAGVTLAAGAAFAPFGFAGKPTAKIDPDWKITKGRIKQSVMGWCFKQKPNPISSLDLAKACKDIGIPAMEGISQDDYPAVMDMGLKISLVSSHGFKTGPFDRSNHDKTVETLKKSIDVAVKVNCKSVITFTGMRVPGISDKEGERNCIDGWKKAVGYAENKGVNLVLEHLNSVDDSHPMKGHPGYFGDDVDHCIDMIKKVDSPNMKLLFDIYHVSIMNGDVIRRIRKYKDYIGHYHTAGNPGRAELDGRQEINYPAVMREILKTKYDLYVAQEFIPTWDDKIGALRHAAKVCDV